MTEQVDPAAEGRAVLDEAVSAFRAAFGDRLLAAYALGSLAHGGFSPLVSDVDLGLVLRDPLEPPDPGAVGAVADAVKAGRSALHRRLSVFWGTPGTLRAQQPGGRFPALDRLDLIENGRLLAGEEVRGDLPAPSREELVVTGAEFGLDFLGPGVDAAAGPTASGLGSLTPGEDTVEEIRRPARLVARGPRHVTKIVLFPVRFLFTAATGRVGTNEAAVTHYRSQSGARSPELVAAAFGWRVTPPHDGHTAEKLLGRELLPLYLEYIDDHTTRLTDLDRPDLAARFSDWRTALFG